MGTSMEVNETEISEEARSARPAQTCCPIVELRQYTLHSGKRDVLIDLFDREFVESQEALGISVIGQFRDLDDPNRFVWLRGFRDMASRAQALQAFYGGPVWKAHREAANATMVDSDNVLLLHPAHSGSGFPVKTRDRLAPGASGTPKGLVVATIYRFDEPVGNDFLEFFERMLKPVLTENGASILAYFVTESSENTFPALPVREGEDVFVWFSCFQDLPAYEHYVATLAQSQRWRVGISGEFARRIESPLEVRKLSPTARSAIRA
jgi:quinol monooxygenase YgiN